MEEPYPSRVEAVLMAFAEHAAVHERMLSEVVEAFARKSEDGGWEKR